MADFNIIVQFGHNVDLSDVLSLSNIVQGLGSEREKVMSQDAVTKNIPERKVLTANEVSGAPFGFYYINLNDQNNANIVGLPTDTYDVIIISRVDKNIASLQDNPSSQIAVGRNRNKVFFRSMRGQTPIASWREITTASDLTQILEQFVRKTDILNVRGYNTDKVLSQNFVWRGLPDRTYLYNPSMVTNANFGFHQINQYILPEIGLPRGDLYGYNMLSISSQEKDTDNPYRSSLQIAGCKISGKDIIFFRTVRNGVPNEEWTELVSVSDLTRVLANLVQKTDTSNIIIPRVMVVDASRNLPINIYIDGHFDSIYDLEPEICLVYRRRHRRNKKKLSYFGLIDRSKNKWAVVESSIIRDDLWLGNLLPISHRQGFFKYPQKNVVNYLSYLSFVFNQIQPATAKDIFGMMVFPVTNFDNGQDIQDGFFVQKIRSKDKKFLPYNSAKGTNRVFECGLCVRVKNPKFYAYDRDSNITQDWIDRVPKYLFGQVTPIRLSLTSTGTETPEGFVWSLSNRR